MNVGIALVITVLLLAGNAFFVGAEFAVITARRDRLEALAAQGRARARTAIRAGEQVPLLIAGAQLGVTVCSLILGALSEPTISGLLQRPFDALGVPHAVLHAVGFVVALAIVAVLHTVLGEMVPKNLAIAGPERAAMWLVPAHLAFCTITRPLLDLFTLMATGLLRLAKVQRRDELETAYTPEEIGTLFRESRQEGLLDDAEHRRLASTLSSARRTVADVLIPMNEITTITAPPTINELETAVTATGFSRFPVRAAHGELIGYLHVKDVLDRLDDSDGALVVADRMRGLPTLPAATSLDAALSTMRRARSHLAGAVGADGTMLGVVTMEDLVEQYVGTVRDGTHVETS